MTDDRVFEATGVLTLRGGKVAKKLSYVKG